MKINSYRSFFSKKYTKQILKLFPHQPFSTIITIRNIHNINLIIRFLSFPDILFNIFVCNIKCETD